MPTEVTERVDGIVDPTDGRIATGPDSASEADSGSVSESSISGATEETVVDAAPTWFRPNKRTDELADDSLDEDESPSSDESSVAPPDRPQLRFPSKRRMRIVVEADDREESSRWDHRFVRWVTGRDASGFGVSLVLHALLLTALAFWYLDLVSDGVPGNTVLGFSEDDGSAFDFGPEDSAFDEVGGQSAQEVSVVDVSERIFEQGDPVQEAREIVEKGLAVEIPTIGDGQGVEDGDGEAEAESGGRKWGDNTKTKGIFTVRVTSVRNKQPDQKAGENFDPAPNESYYIYIYVEVGEDSVESLRLSDVRGSIREMVPAGVQRVQPWWSKIPFHEGKDIRRNRDGSVGYLEGTETAYYNPRSRNRTNPFVIIEDRHVARDQALPISRRRVGGKLIKSVVLRVFVPAAAEAGIRDDVVIECTPLGERQRFEVVF